MTAACPCGSGLAYAGCCGPAHDGSRPAPTAEALMRSRYAAFVRGDVDYLVRTLHPKRRSPREREDLAGSIGATRWTGLTVLAREAGGPADMTGTVTFEARYEGGVLREKSRFVKRNGAWVYVDGELS